ncbi:MAG: sigma 54-interacting transcriptional regulator [Firmicutes bacterium]|nr:sigma 54-interacting transcriptional regulator [Bacillota bacterium]
MNKSAEEKMRSLIRGEDPASPLSDLEIARMIGLPRSTVTDIRLRLNIPNSRERRARGIARVVHGAIDGQGVSGRELARRLRSGGFRVSHTSIRGVVARAVSRGYSGGSGSGDDFEDLVGASGSLKSCIQLAKAAVMYPPRSLNTLILGPTGSGKSELATRMYRYGVRVGVLPAGSPFVVMNCADYADNPQLLMSHLFGQVKGAYTGATEDRRGLVEIADGGVLFLDEIHRMPPQGQEMLFTLLDRGTFRRLGETGQEYNSEFMLIGATCADPGSSLLEAFVRRIPVVIRIPGLNERPIAERMDMLRAFFKQESAKLNRPVRVSGGAVQAFLNYHCPGNAGQMKSDTQVACARAFLRALTSDDGEMVVIQVEDLAPHVARGLFVRTEAHLGLPRYVNQDLIITPAGEEGGASRADAYSLPANIYEWIEERTRELERQGSDRSAIPEAIGRELEGMIRKHIRAAGLRSGTMKALELSRMVDPVVLQAVQGFLAQERAGRGPWDESLVACLAIHLSASTERVREGRPVPNPKMQEVKAQYPEEYRLAGQLLEAVECATGVFLSEDERAFVAMYLRSSFSDQDDSPAVGVVLMSHGKVASAVAEVTRALLPASCVEVFELDLNESPQDGLPRAIEAVRRADKGAGVLILADMGSVLAMGDVISEKTGVPTRTITPLTSPFAIEATRRAMAAGASLDDIADALGKEPGVAVHRPRRSEPRAKTVLVTCLTGRGLADRLAGELRSVFEADKAGVTLIPCSPVQVPDVVRNVGLENVVAAVGSVDPKLPGIRFFPASEVLSGRRMSELKAAISGADLRDLIREDLIFVGLHGGDRDEVIRYLSGLLEKRGLVTPGFAASALEREMIGPTYIGYGVAIPHGDVQYVVRPAVAAARLAKPCPWGNEQARFVMLMALTPECLDAVVEMYERFADDRVRKALESSDDPASFARALLG